MRRTTRFRRLVEADRILVMPGVYDPLSARLAAEAGFDAITCGGYAATATHLGQPDTSQLTMSEFADHYARLCDSVEIPVFGDMDTGFGNATNAARAMRAYERAGLAGVFIEDQVFPKRCGHMAGKDVVPAAEFLPKLKAVLDARQDSDFVVMARTDALAVEGLDAAIERANLYREAGADLLFVEAPRTIADMRRICAEVNGPCMANTLETGLTPLLPADELEAIGYALVAHPVGALYAVVDTLRGLFAELRETGTTEGWLDRMTDFEGFADLVGLPALRAREQAVLDFSEDLLRRHGQDAPD
ncbi:isocitrate lyase/PEP mutase family protein [Roseospira navarrensis]|uniref:Carboxyvinyl-carboxyphosphonate phosphorylmutase n=1 Tax=Roseospira navarrensis TaxID=140058 RepID=A0A7X2D352_9PROT|nr:oxaloacetate decarboxylase [Roseospira navarrensis]MQX35212.1 carboxyvinyl-carboxyphosphonate phosphorylmutase [Roseospira navarrensis]